MPAKIIHCTSHEDYVPEVKKRHKPKPWIEPDWLKQYKLERDRIIWKLHPESRKEIEEYYGLNP